MGVVVGCQVYQSNVVLEQILSDGRLVQNTLGSLHPWRAACLPPQLHPQLILCILHIYIVVFVDVMLI